MLDNDIIRLQQKLNTVIEMRERKENEDIENSNADIAKDLRLLVRKKLTEGESKKEIISFVHSRYGDFVLFSPPFRYDTLGLWIFPLIFFIYLSYLFFRSKN